MVETLPAHDASLAALPPWLLPSLQQLLGSTSHALLLQGASGLGQWNLANTLAASLLCETALGEQARSYGQPCGRCPACNLIAAHSHPDLRYLVPETWAAEIGFPLDEKAQKDIDEKKRKPSREIRAEALRDVVSFTLRTAARARGQVVVIYPAEQMNTIAANTLLKTLEEPLGEVRLILATEAADQLLPTIKSRCQVHKLPWPDVAQASAYLHLHHQAHPEAIADALRASGGRPQDALTLLQDGSATVWHTLPKALAAGQASVFANFAPQAMINLQHKVLHDLWAVKVHAPTRYFTVQDLPPPPPARALHHWSQQLAHWARTIEHPHKADLLLEDMLAHSSALWRRKTA